ncbi:MAG: exo-alpha-sialidase [Chloroflexi bacterium]|nr:exo-alpha-sialidase [Chloroflexota bacterium]
MAASGAKVHVIMWQDQSIAYQRSDDRGVTWLPDTKLATKTATTTYHAQGIAASGNLVVALFTAKGPGPRQSLVLRRSIDGGLNWKSKQTVATPPGRWVTAPWSPPGPRWSSRGRTGRMARSRHAAARTAARRSSPCSRSAPPPTAAAHIGMAGSSPLSRGRRSTSFGCPRRTRASTFRRSTDIGATWKPAQAITNAAVGGGTPAASASGAKVLVQYEGPSDSIKVARSPNSGSTFAIATVVPVDSYSDLGDVFSSPARAPG